MSTMTDVPTVADLTVARGDRTQAAALRRAHAAKKTKNRTKRAERRDAPAPRQHLDPTPGPQEEVDDARVLENLRQDIMAEEIRLRELEALRASRAALTTRLAEAKRHFAGLTVGSLEDHEVMARETADRLAQELTELPSASPDRPQRDRAHLLAEVAGTNGASAGGPDDVALDHYAALVHRAASGSVDADPLLRQASFNAGGVATAEGDEEQPAWLREMDLESRPLTRATPIPPQSELAAIDLVLELLAKQTMHALQELQDAQTAPVRAEGVVADSVTELSEAYSDDFDDDA